MPFPNGLRGWMVLDENGNVEGLTGDGTSGPDHVPVSLGVEPLAFLSDGFGNAIFIEYTP